MGKGEKKWTELEGIASNFDTTHTHIDPSHFLFSFDVVLHERSSEICFLVIRMIKESNQNEFQHFNSISESQNLATEHRYHGASSPTNVFIRENLKIKLNQTILTKQWFFFTLSSQW